MSDSWRTSNHSVAPGVRTLWISPESPRHWWRRRDSYPIPFGMAWTMPSSGVAGAMPDAERVIPSLSTSDPSAGSVGCPIQPVYESLQGRASWPRPTPRRCQSTVASGWRVHRMSPVFTSLSRAKATIAFHFNRTRVRKHYTTGSTYVAVSLGSHLTLPEQQGRRLAS